MLNLIFSLFGLIAMTALAFSALVLTNHFIGFYVALALYQFTVNKEVTKYIILLSGASWLLMLVVKNNFKIKWDKSLLWIGLFIIWAAFSIIISLGFPKDLSLVWKSDLYSPYFLGWNNLMQLIIAYFIFTYVLNIVSNEKILLNVLRILIISGTIVCAISLIVWFSNIYLHIPISLPLSRGGVMGGVNVALAFEPLAFANQILVVLPLVTFMLIMREKVVFPRPAVIIIFIINLMALLSTSSVGGIAAYFVAILITMLLIRGMMLKKRILSSALIVIILLLGPIIYLQNMSREYYINYMFNKIGRAFFSTSVKGFDRAANNESLLRMFRDNPIAGVGFGNFGYSYKYYCPDNSPVIDTGIFKANNDWLTILGETGGVGFMLFFVFIASILYRAYKYIKHDTLGNKIIIIGLTASNLAIWLQALGGFFIQSAYVWVIMAVLLAAININKRSSVNSIQNIKNENSY